MTKQLPISLRSLCRLSLQVAIATGILSSVMARSAQAVPLTCPSIYISVRNSTQIYSVNTTNAVVTPAATLPVASAIGIAVVGGTTPTLYSDTNTAPNHLTSTNGTTTTNNTTATFTGYGGGLGTDTSGRMFYFGSPNTTANTQTLYRFATPTSPVASVTTITSADPIWGQLRPGDMMSDGNGRLYYFGTIAGTGTENYLFYVDSSNIAHQLGHYTGGTGIGSAFDPTGALYTLDGTNLYRIDLANGFTATLIGSTKTATGATISGIDMASCGLPVLNPDFSAQNAIVKQVRNVTKGETVFGVQDAASVGDFLEYQITITNSGKLPSDTTKFADTIPAGTTYVAASTKMYNSAGTQLTPVTSYPDVAGVAPFAAAATGTTPATAAGMLVNTYGQLAGVVETGAANAVVIKFQVKVTATNGILSNSAKLTYPVAAAASGGTVTVASQTSNTANTALSVNVSGTVWNDLDVSGKTGTVFTTGETGTNANSTSLYAYLVNSTNQVIATSPIAANGTYSFTGVLPNQTGLKIELTTTPPPTTLPSTTLPAPSIPTGWKNTAPLIISSINTTVANISGKDFGIVQAANPILVKRITAIKPAGTATWVRTTNPNDATPLNTVVHNPADTANNDTNSNWPTSYLVGAYNAGNIKPGDELEYTVYYLSTQGAGASSLKICDPIRGRQTYNAGSMQLQPGGTGTPIPLTDAVDGADRANTYTATTTPTDCNAGSSTATGTASTITGAVTGLAIQLTGTGAGIQKDLNVLTGATAPGTPPASYGWFRFTAKVDP